MSSTTQRPRLSLLFTPLQVVDRSRRRASGFLTFTRRVVNATKALLENGLDEANYDSAHLIDKLMGVEAISLKF